MKRNFVLLKSYVNIMIYPNKLFIDRIITCECLFHVIYMIICLYVEHYIILILFSTCCFITKIDTCYVICNVRIRNVKFLCKTKSFSNIILEILLVYQINKRYRTISSITEVQMKSSITNCFCLYRNRILQIHI